MGWGEGRVGLGGQGGCVRRIEVFCENSGGGSGWGVFGFGGGQGRCERRIEVFVKIQKNGGGGGSGVGGGLGRLGVGLGGSGWM